MKTLSFNHQLCSLRPNLSEFALNFTQNLDDAEDLVQDTMIKAFRYSGLYREGTNFKGWLYTIMKNTFINNYRTSARKKQLVIVCEDLNAQQLATSATGNLGENTFVRQDLNKAIKAIGPDHYVPFLKYFEGFKYHEIAQELNIPIGTVKTRIHMARKLMKASLKMYNQKLESFRNILP